MEKATSKLAAVKDLAPTGDGMPELVHTPGQKTIDEVGAFLGVEPVHQMKTMAYIVEHPDADEKQIKTVGKTRAVVVFLRGDHQINETKLAAIAGGELRPMQAEEIVPTFNAPAGLPGPIGLTAAPHPEEAGDAGHSGCGAGRADELDCRGEQGGVPPAQRDADARLQADAGRRRAQRQRGRARPDCAASRCGSPRRSKSATSSSWATSTRSRWARRC